MRRCAEIRTGTALYDQIYTDRVTHPVLTADTAPKKAKTENRKQKRER